MLLFTFILLLIVFGYQFQKKITTLVVWFSGVFFSYFFNKLDDHLQKKKPKNNKKINSNRGKLIINFTCLSISIILFILSLVILNSHHNAFAIDYSLLLGSSFCFFLIFSQYTDIKYPKLIKKIIRFMASYSFTLYLIHVSIFFFYKIFLKEMNNFLLFLLVYIIVNIVSILIASFSEMQASKIKNWFLKIFK
jgi:peptidoglycan/LPS O-acetylase OafA/YrhL